MFGIASNTKAFTCAALSILAEDRRLDWDDPVTKHLPEFQMYDPWVTREVTLRDLVTHRAGLGLGQGDLMWWPATDFTRREIVRGIRHLKPVSSLRSRYAYSNVMFVAAGEVVAQVSGRSWDDFLRERIFVPLGMSRTNTSVASNGSNVATPHLLVKGRPSPVAPMQADNCGAAGAINSSVSDTARWLRMLLECGHRGASGGEACVLKPDSIQRLWSAQVALATPAPPPGLEALRANFVAYGLGFGLRSRGELGPGDPHQPGGRGSLPGDDALHPGRLPRRADSRRRLDGGLPQAVGRRGREGTGGRRQGRERPRGDVFALAPARRPRGPLS